MTKTVHKTLPGGGGGEGGGRVDGLVGGVVGGLGGQGVGGFQWLGGGG